MSKHLSTSTLRSIAQVYDMGKGDQLRRFIQAIIEGKSSGESSLDGKFAGLFQDIAFTEANFHETIIYRGQLMKRHRRGGGWVPFEQDEHDKTKPFVAETVFVGPWAMVYGNARVLGKVGLYDFARVCDHSTVSDEVWICHNGRVCGSATVFGNVYISGNGVATDNAVLYGIVHIHDGGVAGGNVRLSSGEVRTAIRAS